MKNLLVLPIIFLSLIVSSVAYAKWTQVAKSVDGHIYYVDFERIKKHSGKVYYWQLTDHIKPGHKGTMSSKIYVESECGRFRYRWHNRTYYNGPLASGTILHETNTPQKDWNYPTPDSVGEDMLKTVCDHKSMQ